MKDRSSSLNEFVADAGAMAAAAFAEEHGSAFLIRFSTVQPTEPLTADQWLNAPTQIVHKTVQVPVLYFRPGEGANHRVYPVRQRVKRAGSLISVGRAPANDICIDDISLSKFHAQFEPDGEGGFGLRDKDSTNGTMVGKAKLEPSVVYRVGTNDSVRFGVVQLIFMRAPEFMAFVSPAHA